MNVNERIAALTTLKKACDAALKELRADSDAELLDAYEESGVQKVALKIGGVKVGDYTVPLSKPKYEVFDERLFGDFALDYGLGHVVHKVEYEPDWQDRMTLGADGLVYLEDSGLPVPGVAYMPERPMTPKVMGCDPKKVLPLIAQLPEGIAGLLGE